MSRAFFFTLFVVLWAAVIVLIAIATRHGH
jgi:hypothetical protein